MAETKTHLVLAHHLGYIDEPLHREYHDRLIELGKMLHGYINHLRNQKTKNRLNKIPSLEDEYEI